MKVTLEIVRGPGVGTVREIFRPAGLVIGRGADADFQVAEDDAHASRRHVYLEISPPVCHARDIGTTNPAHVNGQPFDECELHTGDLIQVGGSVILVGIDSSVELRTVPCARCGAGVEVMEDEAPPPSCSRCSRFVLAVDADEVDGPPIRCACGCDLTPRAYSDGRARELRDAVTYCCEGCLPDGDGSAGVRFGPYVVRRVLGEGGMGIVYLAHDPRTTRLVALKSLRDLQRPQLTRRFHREIRILREFDHPNVVRAVGSGDDENGRPYLVTEYLGGGSVADLQAARGGRLTPGLAVAVTLEVLRGLDYIHSRSVVHRDVKPPNILLAPGRDPMRDAGTVKLADFGLSVSYLRAGGTWLTFKGVKLGSHPFMPPEQILDPAEVRETADTYATGATLYHLLTGAFPYNFASEPGERGSRRSFRGLKRLAFLRDPFTIILEDTPVPIRTRAPEMSVALAAVVDRALQKKPAERYSTAREMAEALRRLGPMD